MDLSHIWDSLVAPVPGDRESDWCQSEIYYPTYQTLGQSLAPDAIFEIGTRVGHSLIALSSQNPRLRKISWVDDETYVGSSNTLARLNLSDFYRRHRADWSPPELEYSRTYPPVSELCGMFDLCHIDGDHSYQGKLRDLEYCLKIKPLWILADDYHHHAQVGQAVRDWVRCAGLPLYVLPTLRGLAVIPTLPQVENWTVSQLLGSGLNLQKLVPA